MAYFRHLASKQPFAFYQPLHRFASISSIPRASIVPLQGDEIFKNEFRPRVIGKGLADNAKVEKRKNEEISVQGAAFQKRRLSKREARINERTRTRERATLRILLAVDTSRLATRRPLSNISVFTFDGLLSPGPRVSLVD